MPTSPRALWAIRAVLFVIAVLGPALGYWLAVQITSSGKWGLEGAIWACSLTIGSAFGFGLTFPTKLVRRIGMGFIFFTAVVIVWFAFVALGPR